MDAAAAILAAIPDGLLWVDAAGLLVGQNKAAAELLSPELRVGVKVAGIIPALAPVLERARRESLRGEVQLGGGAVDLRAVPIAEGGVLLLLRPPGQLEQRTRDAQEASRWSALAAGLAHEIRNPLAGIEGAATLLARSATAEMAPLAEVVQRESRRIAHLLEELMHLARPRPPRPEAEDLHRLLDDALALQEAGRPAGVRFERRFDPSLPELLLDAEQVMQVLHNLLRNAIEALGEAQGTVTVSTGLALGLSSGPPKRRRSMARLTVEDTGPGFDARVLAEPFTPFVTTKASGTGLGLALCRRVVEAHGGLVELKNLPGGGAQVALFLPLSAQAGDQ